MTLQRPQASDIMSERKQCEYETSIYKQGKPGKVRERGTDFTHAHMPVYAPLTFV